MSSHQDFRQNVRSQDLITVKACKYDGSVHRSWKCELIEENDNYWAFVGIFSEEIRHPLLGVIRPATISYEFYWKDQWYNVFRFHEPEGSLRNFYCNVNMPPVFNESVLTYIDLDIDVLVAPDFSYQILDLEEFEENAQRHNYSTEVIEKSRSSLTQILALIEKRQFPFDYNSTSEG